MPVGKKVGGNIGCASPWGRAAAGQARWATALGLLKNAQEFGDALYTAFTTTQSAS